MLGKQGVTILLSGGYQARKEIH